MDIIVTAKVDFSVAENRWVRLNSVGVKEGSAQTRVVPREFSLEGDNQVPIMIVNEDDRRIKKISSINPSNIDGIGLGESPEIYEPFKVTVKFITDYQDNQKDVINLQYIDEKYGTVNDIILFETDNDSRIFYYEEDTNELDIRPDSIENKNKLSASLSTDNRYGW